MLKLFIYIYISQRVPFQSADSFGSPTFTENSLAFDNTFGKSTVTINRIFVQTLRIRVQFRGASWENLQQFFVVPFNFYLKSCGILDAVKSRLIIDNLNGNP